MKIFVHNLVDDKFTNDQTGEIIDYSNAMIYEDEHNNSTTNKGRKIIKVKTSKGLLSRVDAENLPGWFDAEIGIGTAGKLILTNLKPIPKDQKIKAA
jgi:hypothetical protein